MICTVLLASRVSPARCSTAAPTTGTSDCSMRRTWAREDPIDALAVTVLGGGIAFYLAERDTNPGCATPWDAILYMATCLSVGYDNLFPTTSTGHTLALPVQTFGPALSGMAFDAPATEAPAEPRQPAPRRRGRRRDRAILDKLDEIVRLLGEAKGG